MSDEAREILSRSLVHQISQLQAECDKLRADLAAEREQAERLAAEVTHRHMLAIKEARADLADAREALKETLYDIKTMREHEIEKCADMGYSEGELPDFAFELWDNAIARIDAALKGGVDEP